MQPDVDLTPKSHGQPGLGWAVLPWLVSPEQPRFGVVLAVGQLLMLWPALWRLVQSSHLRLGCRSPPTLGLRLPIFRWMIL